MDAESSALSSDSGSLGSDSFEVVGRYITVHDKLSSFEEEVTSQVADSLGNIVSGCGHVTFVLRGQSQSHPATLGFPEND